MNFNDKEEMRGIALDGIPFDKDIDSIQVYQNRRVSYSDDSLEYVVTVSLKRHEFYFRDLKPGDRFSPIVLSLGYCLKLDTSDMASVEISNGRLQYFVPTDKVTIIGSKKR